MNEIKIVVNFEKHQCDFEKYDDIKSLISGDYNSTKLIFEFDREDGRKIFEMKNPKGELVFADEIVNNEVILVGKDEQGNNCSLFTTAGTYPFEISLYGDDSKLTSESNCFSVQQEQVEIDGKVVEFYMPIFDKLLNDVQDSLESVNNAIDEVDTLDIDVNKSGTTTTVELTKKDGTTDTVEILDGEQGEQGIPGQDGYTPQKGIDYFTPEDIESLNIPTKLSELTDDLGSSPVHTHSQYLTEHQDISMKQNIEDNTLNTNNKTVPSAINEVNSIAKGANQALSYSNYQSMINVFNNLANNVYNVGQNVMIVTLQVPDLWISGIESTSQTYIYTSDSDFVNALATNGYVQVGYYKLSALETQKVDLTNYVKNIDYATGSKGGTVRSGGFGINVNSTGQMFGVVHSYAQYNTDNNTQVISKGTLENVITGKDLTTKSYVDGLVGDIATALDTIQGEVI